MKFGFIICLFSICLFENCAPKNMASHLSESEFKEKVQKLSVELLHCIRTKKIIPQATAITQETLSSFHKQFQQEPCTGCHTGYRSLSETGRIAFAGTEKEFAKGLAIRHHQTIKIVDLCLAEGPSREDLKNKFLENTRINSSSGDRFFKSTGDPKKDGDIAASFLQGAFESRMTKGDPLFDLAYIWIQNGSYLPAEAYSEILAEMIGLYGYMEKVSVVN